MYYYTVPGDTTTVWSIRLCNRSYYEISGHNTVIELASFEDLVVCRLCVFLSNLTKIEYCEGDT